MKSKIKPKFRLDYGNEAVKLKDVRMDEIKVRITTFLDLDVIDMLKARAGDLGMGYQTFLNTFLREVLLNEPGILTRLKRIEKALAGRKAKQKGAKR
jgi:uncharacterized protein (DUF4415 family)